MSNEATEYVTWNAGIALDQGVDEATEYVTWNAGEATRSRVGAVYGLSGPQFTPAAYVYLNTTT